MKLRTEIQPLDKRGMVDYHSRIVMVGSCFTDEVGQRLRSDMFQVEVNPFGTLYNPESMASEIEAALDGRTFVEADIFEENGLYRTFRRHSSFSQPDSAAMVATLNADIERIGRELLDADLLIATFGSSIAFRHIPTGKIVANCHKQPSNLFEREIIPLDVMTERWEALLRMLSEVNPKLRVILTISPVRHSGYGLALDRLSKSMLCVMCHELIDRLEGAIDIVYFPSYEILVDDLRDYRFYADDLAHPSKMAVDYVYDMFRESFMHGAVILRCKQWEKITRRLKHRLSQPNPEFQAQTLTLAEKLAELSSDKDAMMRRFKQLSKNDN